MLPYEAILTWGGGGARCCGGTITTVLITGSRAGLGVHRPNVPLAFINL
jgi:hypothetical protein